MTRGRKRTKKNWEMTLIKVSPHLVMSRDGWISRRTKGTPTWVECGHTADDKRSGCHRHENIKGEQYPRITSGRHSWPSALRGKRLSPKRKGQPACEAISRDVVPSINIYSGKPKDQRIFFDGTGVNQSPSSVSARVRSTPSGPKGAGNVAKRNWKVGIRVNYFSHLFPDPEILWLRESRYHRTFTSEPQEHWQFGQLTLEGNHRFTYQPSTQHHDASISYHIRHAVSYVEREHLRQKLHRCNLLAIVISNYTCVVPVGWRMSRVIW
ncbi:hypothetical protein F5Y16DRAFT_348164 [Xylariaceae sp. FL0255]|nr:hypothetical protein F5Y16DRAFT_348164 [Xylariaceae sp. FL0255]